MENNIELSVILNSINSTRRKTSSQRLTAPK